MTIAEIPISFLDQKTVGRLFKKSTTIFTCDTRPADEHFAALACSERCHFCLGSFCVDFGMSAARPVCPTDWIWRLARPVLSRLTHYGLSPRRPARAS